MKPQATRPTIGINIADHAINLANRDRLTSLILLLLMLCTIPSLNAQVQKGSDIDGESGGDNSGSSVSMADANTVAIGAPGNDGFGSDAGHVRIYTWDGSAWIQKGDDIDGEGAADRSGFSVSMADANTVAIGAPNNGTLISSGHVRIYTWDGSAWIQKGGDIDGEGADDRSGASVSMADANTVAIGAPDNSGNANNAGHVRIYTWDGSAWVQKGDDIDGEAEDDQSGWSVSMADPNTVAIGAPENDGNGNNAGHVRIYSWDGSAWTQKGTDIEGETAGDTSGASVSMADANTVAIGAPENDGNGNNAGHVRIYSWDGSAWTQKGTDIEGEAQDNLSGASVSMADANNVAIGAPENNATNSGHVRIYTWDGSAWGQKGAEIDGEAAFDESGTSVSMADANTVAIGAPGNSGTGTNAGHVRVYNVTNTAIGEKELSTQTINVYPNPAEERFHVDYQGQEKVSYKVMDITGQVIRNGTLSGPTAAIDLSDREQGIYLLTVKAQTVKLIKQ